jgi:RND family efflux transporter MFP subunit
MLTSFTSDRKYASFTFRGHAPGEHDAMTHPIPSTLADAALAAVLAGCSSHAATPPEPEPAIPVHVAPVGRGEVRHPVKAAGTVGAKDRRDLSFKVGGLLARITVREGDAIRKGQVLAALDETELSAGVRQAREGLEKARRDRDRARTLSAAGVIPRAAGEDAETAHAVAEAALEAATFNLRHAVIVAPDAGWVDRRMAEPGEIAAPGRPVLQVSGLARGFVVRVNLPDRDVLGLAPGGAATVTLDAAPGQPLPARIAEISRSATRGTGTYQVELGLVPGARAPRLLNGLTAKVEIERNVSDARTVPIAALQDGDGASGAVFVADGDRARRIPVRVAFLQGGQVVLASGLDGVDQVVTDGASRLVDGAHLRLVP